MLDPWWLCFGDRELSEGLGSGYMFSTHAVFLWHYFSLFIENNVYLFKWQVVSIVTWVFGKTVKRRPMWFAKLMGQIIYLATGQKLSAQGFKLAHMKPQEWIKLVKFRLFRGSLIHFDFCQTFSDLLYAAHSPEGDLRLTINQLEFISTPVENGTLSPLHKWRTWFWAIIIILDLKSQCGYM